MSTALPPQAELDALAKDNRAPQMIAGIVVLSVVALITLPLRLWAQKRGRGQLWWDDACIIVGATLALVVSISACLEFRWAAGRHILTIVTSSADPLPNIFKWLQAGWVETVFWGQSLCWIKLSLVFFYYRIFALGEKKLRIALWVVGAYIVAIGIVSLFDEIFQCLPVEYFWYIGYLFVGQTPPVSGVCKDLVARGVLMAAFNIASDLLVLAVPVAGIWNLQMPTRKKLAVVAMFLLGTGCTVISIVRIPYLLSSSLSDDASWANSYPILFTALEPMGGVFCANLMCLPPLLRAKNRGTSAGSYSGESSWARSRRSLQKFLTRSKNTSSSSSGKFASTKMSDSSDRSESEARLAQTTVYTGYQQANEYNSLEPPTVTTKISANHNDIEMGDVEGSSVDRR